MSHEQNRTTWVSTSSFEETLDTLALFFLSGKGGQGVQKSPLPRFLHSLVGDRPEILSGRPLSNYNKAMSHEEAEPHNMGFYPLHSGWGDFGHPCPIFLSGKIGQGVPNPSIPRFLHSLVGDRPEILSGRPLSNYNKAMSHEQQEPSQHGPYFPLREKWARVSKSPLHFRDFGGSPFARDVFPMSHERQAQMGFYLFIGTPLPYFPLRKIGQSVQILYTPISA